MANDLDHPTAFPDVNSLIGSFSSQVREILGDQLTGMYLCGSLALGDFNPHKSDIDFVVATAGKLPDELFESLKSMHEKIAGYPSKWALEIEGSYLPQRSLRRYDPSDSHHPHLSRGSGLLAIEQHDTDWLIQYYILRERGVILYGPEPKSLIDPISPEDLQAAVLGLLWWWEFQLKDTSRVEKSPYQAYAVLSMCRILYTLQSGRIVSKPEAACWVMSALGGRWAQLIDKALNWQPGTLLDRLDDTLDFIRYTLEFSRRYA